MIPDSAEVCWEKEFSACWLQYGGSGYQIDRRSYLELDIDQRDWILERIEEQREKEANAIKSASGG